VSKPDPPPGTHVPWLPQALDLLQSIVAGQQFPSRSW
jgi:hypothetical protein